MAFLNAKPMSHFPQTLKCCLKFSHTFNVVKNSVFFFLIRLLSFLFFFFFSLLGQNLFLQYIIQKSRLVFKGLCDSITVIEIDNRTLLPTNLRLRAVTDVHKGYCCLLPISLISVPLLVSVNYNCCLETIVPIFLEILLRN